jgi:hypothetical protein
LSITSCFVLPGASFQPLTVSRLSYIFVYLLKHTARSSSFAFVPSSVSPSNDTVQTTGAAILLGGSGTFIGYGALKKEFEILEITENSMYLRVQGTEPGNAWYLRLVPVQ